MSKTLKLEISVADIGQNGVVVSEFATTEYVANELSKKATLNDEGKVDPSLLPDYTYVDGLVDKLDDVEQSLLNSDAEILNAAKLYSDNKIAENNSKKADLVEGKVPFEQLPFSMNFEQNVSTEFENVRQELRQNSESIVAQMDGLVGSANSYTDGKVLDEREFLNNTINEYKGEVNSQLNNFGNEIGDILKSGAYLPYDPDLEYVEGALILKDGEIQQFVEGVWLPFKTNALNIVDESGLNQQEINNNVIDATVGKPTTAKTFVLNPLNRMMGRVLEEKLNGEFASVKDGGAIGDGTLHTLQEWVDSGKFSSLASIKLVYPTATALTDSIDAVVIQTWVDKYKRVLIPHGIYLINKTIAIDGSGCELYGESVSTYGEGDTVKTRFVHVFNGDMITLNTTTVANPRGRHRIRGIAFASDDNFSGRAIVLRSSQNHLVDLSFFKFKDGGIRIQGRSYGTYIIKPSFDRCGSNGAYDISVDIDTGGASAADYNTITVVADGIFETPKTGAISIKDSDPFYLYRNYIEPFSSTSNKPMVDIKNSPSGNTKGWVYDNYIGSINGNGLAISAVGANLFVNHNMIADFNNGIYFATQTGSCKGNIIGGYSGNGIQVASTAAGVNNNAEVSGNMLLSKVSGAVHGIILSNSVNGGTVTSNIVRGKHDYYVRLVSAHNFLVESNNLLPRYGDATSGSGVYEDDNCTGNVVKANNVQAATKYRRYSFEYDDFYLPSTASPVSGVWKKGDIVKVPDPVAFGAIGYICITAGTGAAAVWEKYGLIIKQIPARPDVVASNLATLVAAHNALLADLRAANIMVT